MSYIPFFSGELPNLHPCPNCQQPSKLGLCLCVDTYGAFSIAQVKCRACGVAGPYCNNLPTNGGLAQGSAMREAAVTLWQGFAQRFAQRVAP
jgi:hypothetical protein